MLMYPHARWELLYLFALALLATGLTLVLNPGHPTGPDIHSYVPIAEAIVADPSYLTRADAFQGNFWSMGYPTLLAVMLWTTGSVQGVTVLQAVVIGTLVFVPWLLTRHIPGSTRFIAPAVLVVCPPIWGIGTSIGYEAVYALVLCYSLAIAWIISGNRQVTQRHSIWLAILTGLLLGVGVLIQSKTVIVVPVILYLLYKNRIQLFWLGVFGFLIPILPWSIRNIFVLRTANPLAENGPFNLWVGNNPVTTTGGSMLEPPPVPAGQSATSAAIDFLINQPERAIELVILKSARLTQPLFVYPEILQPGPGRTTLHVLAAATNLLIVLGVIAFLGARLVGGPQSSPRVAALAVFVALFFLVHLPFIAEPRYMTSVLPISVSVAVATWLFTLKRVRGNTARRR